MNDIWINIMVASNEWSEFQVTIHKSAKLLLNSELYQLETRATIIIIIIILWKFIKKSLRQKWLIVGDILYPLHNNPAWLKVEGTFSVQELLMKYTGQLSSNKLTSKNLSELWIKSFWSLKFIKPQLHN